MPLHSHVLQKLLLAYFELCVTLQISNPCTSLEKFQKPRKQRSSTHLSVTVIGYNTLCQRLLNQMVYWWFFFFPPGCICFSEMLMINLFLLKFSWSHASQPGRTTVHSYFSLFLDDERSWTGPFLSFYTFTLKMNNIGTVKILCPLNGTPCFPSLK